MNGEPKAGCYYHPGERKKIWLSVGKRIDGLAGWRPFYAIDYGEYVGVGYCYEVRDWSEWVPYTGQPDHLEESKIASLMALAKAQTPQKLQPASWWRFW